MKLQKRITFQSGGWRPSINALSRLNVMVSVAGTNVEPPRPFEFFYPGVKPVAALSRRLNANDLEFVLKEVAQLL